MRRPDEPGWRLDRGAVALCDQPRALLRGNGSRCAIEGRDGAVSEPCRTCAGPFAGTPAAANTPTSPTGKIPLGLGGRRDGFVYAPTVASRGPLPLVVFMHGSGGKATQSDALIAAAETVGLLVLSIDSRGATWDMIEGDIGPDDAFLDRGVLVSHGTSDKVLPIDACSRRIVPRLRGSGYDVEYHEFEAGHTMPVRVLDRAFAWLLDALPLNEK